MSQVSYEEERIVEPMIIYRLSFYYYALFGFLLTVITGILWSLVLRNDDPPVNRDVLSPAIYCLLSEKKNKNSKEYYSLENSLKVVSHNEKEKV